MRTGNVHRHSDCRLRPGDLHRRDGGRGSGVRSASARANPRPSAMAPPPVPDRADAAGAGAGGVDLRRGVTLGPMRAQRAPGRAWPAARGRDAPQKGRGDHAAERAPPCCPREGRAPPGVVHRHAGRRVVLHGDRRNRPGVAHRRTVEPAGGPILGREVRATHREAARRGMATRQAVALPVEREDASVGPDRVADGA